MTDPNTPKSSAAEEARRLKSEWDQRSQSPLCRFYVASQEGWRNPSRWQAQAEGDVRILTAWLAPEWLKQAEVLEIGCGVGRLVEPLLRRVQSYTGCDVAPGMVAEAKQTHGEEPRARFFESPGDGLPTELEDAKFDFAFSWAVFIHCPKSVVDQLIDGAIQRLRSGGKMRFQLFAEVEDPEGITAPPPDLQHAYQELAHLPSDKQADARDAEAAGKELGDSRYMGHPFGFREAVEFLQRDGCTSDVRRFDASHIYCDLTRL